MQKTVQFIISGIFLFALNCCKTDGNRDVAVRSNPFVEAFTSGNISRFAPIYLIFAYDAAEEKLTPDYLKKHIRIRPETKGEFVRQNASMVMFKPEDSFERDTRYDVMVDIGAWFDAGKEDASFKFSFTTLPIRLNVEEEMLEKVEDKDGIYNIIYNLSTTDKESSQTIEPLIKVSEKCDIEWLHNADEQNHTFILKNIKADKDKRKNIVVSVAPNKVGLPEKELATTVIPGANEFCVHSINYVEEPERYVEISFSQPLNAKQDMEGLAYIEDNTSRIVTVAGNRLRLYPDMNCSGKRNVVLSYLITDKRGQRLNTSSDEDIILEVEVSALLPDIRFTGEGNIIPKAADLVLPFQAVCLRGVTVTIIKIFERNVGQFLQTCELSDNSSSLTQVGRPVARKTIFLDEKGSRLSRWNTFAIRLNDLIDPEPGAVYRITLSANPDLAALPCDTFNAKLTKDQIMANDEEMFKREVAAYDNVHAQYWYYYNEEFDYDNYYENRNNPCSTHYYKNIAKSKNILATNLGLIAKAGQDGDMLFLVHNLLTTAPEKEVNITLYNYQHQITGSATTNEKGQAHITVNAARGLPFYAVASQGKQCAYLRIDDASALSLSSFNVSGEAVQKGIKGFIYGERGVWRPGDTLHLAFMLSDRNRTLPANHPVIMELFTPAGQVYTRKTLTKGQPGLYVFDMPTEPDAPTGAWNAKVQVGGITFDKKIRIESIKPNRLKIQLQLPDKPLGKYAGAGSEIPIHTEWLQGAVAHNLKYDVKAIFTAMPTTFKNYPNYKFDDPAKTFQSEEMDLIEGKTDREGNAVINADFKIDNAPLGMLAANITTRVFEESGDFSIDGVSIPYSPYPVYIGIKSPQTGEEPLVTDAEHSFEIISLNGEGKPVSTHIKMEIIKVAWYWWWNVPAGETVAEYISDYEHRVVERKTITTNAEGKASFKYKTPHDSWGTYIFHLRDMEGGHSTGIFAFFDWPNYGGQRRNQARSEAATVLNIKTDKASYSPGEKMLVTLPSMAGSRAIVSIENGTKIISVNEYNCKADETSIPIDVTADMQPNAYIHVTLIQPYRHAGNDLPIRLYGISPVEVSSDDTRLRPVISTAGEYKPENPYSITISEEKGKSMAYTIAIVDEGLLDLTRFKTPDPWAVFNAKEALGINTWDLYNHILGAYGGRIEQIFSIGGDNAIDKGPKAVVNRFKPVVRFAGPFTLNKGEKKTHTYAMPNYNGRVRIMVVAGDGYAYGSAEKSVPVRKPVMLLGTLPRIIGMEEEILVPATVFATEENIGNVKVSISCSNNISVVGQASKDLLINRKEDKTVAFRIRTGNRPGAAKVTITATAKGEKSTYETDLEIRSTDHLQKTIEALTIEPGKTWKGNHSMPGIDATNSLTLEVSTIPPINLASRLSDLLGYPHGCIEQITSKAFPQLYIKDFATLSAEQESSVSTAIQSTLNRYRSYFTNGAFAYWPGTSDTYPWGTIYAVHFMIEAGNKGYVIPEGMKNSALSAMRKTANEWKSEQHKYSEITQAYRLYVLALAQQAETGAMNRMRENKSLASTSRVLLAAAYALLGRNDVAAQLLAHTDEQTVYDAYDNTFGSSFRDMALYLQTLVLLNKEQEAAATARSISDKLGGNDWLSTQETAWALNALSAWIKKYNTSRKLDFAYTVNGQSRNINSAKSIWTEKIINNASSPARMEIKNNLNSTLFVRILSEGVPGKNNIHAQAAGVELSIAYEDENNRPVEPATMKRGTNFTAVVTVKNPKAEPLTNLVVSQIFPAGWEILNTRFINDKNIGSADAISYQDIRDDRVLSYINTLSGNKRITFRIRLTSVYAGRYYLPPAYCEAMYNRFVQANTEGMEINIGE
ncbi:MAG: hypothetical protein LBH04_07350 [Tannerellaceae bacterium]|jgi:uncharacterized protein YfaS (alpha-2-macroglobulin family)|nr:hypothetical protein [Tannerellaceae bacterium]